MLIRPEIRMDKMGSGKYLASRGTRKHKGIDFCCDKDVEVRSHIDGVVSKIGYPYAQKFDTDKNKKKSALRYVQVTDTDNNHHRFFYLLPSVSIGDPVSAGGVIGKQQDLQAIYGKKMKNHCHYEVKVSGEFVNPENFL